MQEKTKMIRRFVDGVREGQFRKLASYWFALVLCERFGGEMMFHPGLRIFGAAIEGSVWDTSGEVVDIESWTPWWLYQANETSDAENIKRSLYGEE